MPVADLAGVIPAVPTPVSTQGQIDISRLIDFCRQLLDEGADGLNITGTTGEATSLSCDQRLDIISALAKSDLNNNRIMVGTGAAAVADAVALSKAVGEAGLAGALVLPPFYFKDPSEAGLLRYFEAIVSSTAATGIDIYLYNFPALSGVSFTKKLVEELRRAFGGRIKGLKDSSGDLTYARDIAKSFPELKVFPSNEGTLLQAKEGEFAGSISATANLSASACAAAFRDGDRKALERAKSIRALIAQGPLVPRIKAVIAERLSDPIWANVLPPYNSMESVEAKTLSVQTDSLMANMSPENKHTPS